MGARTEGPHKKFTYRESSVDESLEPSADCRLPENSKCAVFKAFAKAQKTWKCSGTDSSMSPGTHTRAASKGHPNLKEEGGPGLENKKQANNSGGV